MIGTRCVAEGEFFASQRRLKWYLIYAFCVHICAVNNNSYLLLAVQIAIGPPAFHTEKQSVALPVLESLTSNY